MGNKVLVVAPHPDDESLGCGGTILKHRARGDSVHWLIMTSVHEAHGFTAKRVISRALEIKRVAKLYGFDGTHQLGFPTTKLDKLPLGELIAKVSDVMSAIKPEIVYIPFGGDIHSDHRITFEVMASCSKWFRYPSVKRILAYEVLSETDAAIDPCSGGFRPNVFNDITPYLDKKLRALALFEGEMGKFPFPRSDKALRSLAACRGAASGFPAAEGFMLLRERL